MRDADGHATLVVVPRGGAPSAGAARIGPQTLVGGRYRLVRRLGEGGAGIVWLAIHEVTGREVALKLLRAEASPHPRFVERFHRESRWTSKLQHPGIVEVLDAGTDDGAPFVVMEYLDGMTLRERLASGAEVSELEALRIARAIATAMAHAHEHGIVHRDLKPENVMLLADGAVKLLDFGVAAPADEGAHERMTVVGEVLGTPGYMAPEHSSGARATTAFDVYSYGMLLHELLGGDDAAQRHPAWRRCEPLVAACTAGDPESRPRFAEIVERFDRMQAGRMRPRIVLAMLGRAFAVALLLAAAGVVVTAAFVVIDGIDDPIAHAPIEPRPAPDRIVPVVVPTPIIETVVDAPPPVVDAKPSSEPQRKVDCSAARKRLVQHREAHRWREMLKTLSSRSCWSRDEHRRWSTMASFELKNFARCARLGTGSPDPEVARWALACRRRLAFEKGE
jgi:serine/threonine protein kinase